MLVPLHAPGVEQKVVALVKEVSEELRDILPVEHQVKALRPDQPLMKGPAEHQLSIRAGELEVHGLRAALDFVQKSARFRKMLDDVRGEDQIATVVGKGQAARIRDEHRCAVRNVLAAVNVVEGILVEDDVRTPERFVSASHLNHEVTGLDLEIPKYFTPGPTHRSHTLLAMKSFSY
jgi:hypothetical protein